MSITRLFGVHAVEAALNYSANKIQKAWVDVQRKDAKLVKMRDMLNSQDISVIKSERKVLDAMSEGKNHQGIVIEIELPVARTEKQLKNDLAMMSDLPLLLILDQVQDPHNLGACLRTADATGVNGIIIPKDNASGITPTVCKVASGAAETIPVYQVTNLARTMRWLKEQHIWLLGTSGYAEQSLFNADLKIPLAVVMGTESTGMRRLTEKECDFLVKIPMLGEVESLNVSVAAAVILYEALKQRSN